MVTGWDAWRILLSCAGLFIVIQLGMGVGFAVLITQRIDVRELLRLDWLLTLNLVLTAIALMTPVFLLGRRRGWRWGEAFRWRPLPWGATVKVTIATLALNIAVSQGLLWLVQWVSQVGAPLRDAVRESGFWQLLEGITHTQHLSPLLLLAVMLPALPEELTFRGVIQQGFERRYAPALAIGLVSLFFALFHLNPLQSLGVLPTSLFWSWVAYRTQSVIPTVIAHACQNGLTVLSLGAVSLWEHGNRASLTPSPTWTPAIGGLLIWVGLTWHLARSLPMPERGVEDGGDDSFALTADQTGATDGSDGGGSLGADECSGPTG